jgi:hypothetical protein
MTRLAWLIGTGLFVPGNVHAAAAPAAQPYTWRAVAMGGGGFVDGILFHPTAKNLLYARTDVGGAYRWDPAHNQWIPLNDWLSEAQVNFTGIESIGLDPSDPSRLYLAAGTYLNGPAAILCSDDQGRTFQITPTPFKMGGNLDGRWNGERLAVDPNDGKVLFFGSRRDGLWKSADRAITWTRVQSFPHIPTGPDAPSCGIVTLLFDATSGHPGAPTPVLYAAVSTTVIASLYRSADAGAHWQAVPGQPTGLMPGHLIRAADGILYLTYNSAPGPNNIHDGALWKYQPATGAWTDITPGKPPGQRIDWGYAGLCADALHPQTIMVSTIDRWGPHDELFRTTDAGRTWRGILINGRMDYSSAPYTNRITPHWMGALAVNPANPDQVLFGTGYGIWASTNATASDTGAPVAWTFMDNGLEETVPLALISPPTGAHLISGVGDIDGFRHDDVSVTPPGGTFGGARFTNTRDLAFAAAQPEVMVRLGDGARAQTHGAISRDGGSTWTYFHTDPPGGTGGLGRIAISADASTVPHGAAFVTADSGATWTPSTGFAGRSLVADPVNPARFYALDSAAGHLLVSSDKGASFSATSASLPIMLPVGWRGTGIVLAIAPGREGDLWAGSWSTGLWHSADGGASFAKVAGVDGVSALGFGKAAPGKNGSAIYLLGTIQGLHARYRSDDQGQTWVRIDDDQHQYAAADIPVIIGDPRIFGRVYITTGGRGVIYGDPASK